MSGYIGPQPVPQAVITRQVFTVAADGTTSFATKGYTVGYVDVYLNGVRLVNGDDYTATNGSDIVLASSAYANDVLEMVALRPFQALNQNLAGTTTTDRLVATGQMDMPTWTSAGRPASPQIGTIGYNTETKALENYTDQGWLKVSVPIPIITSSSGNIYSGVTSTVTLSGLNFGTSTATVTFASGATTATATATPTNGGQSCAVSVPAAIYGLAAGSAVSVTLKNADNATSAVLILTSVGIPTGGTITTAGGYRIHTFTSSGSLVVPTGFSANANYLVVAGGGGGGYRFGGGGAGGYRCSVTGEASGGGASAESALAISAGTYSVTVGAGGAAQQQPDPTAYYGSDGSSSSLSSISCVGGGGGSGNVTDARSGGCGGGASGNGSATGISYGGSGTTGQGYAGGNGWVQNGNNGGGGGGGAGSVGGNAGGANGYGNGGTGVQSSIDGTATYRAGGGGATGQAGGIANGGTGGGGKKGVNSGNGTANTGGGGASGADALGGNGGSGIVIVRYPFAA